MKAIVVMADPNSREEQRLRVQADMALCDFDETTAERMQPLRCKSTVAVNQELHLQAVLAEQPVDVFTAIVVAERLAQHQPKIPGNLLEALRATAERTPQLFCANSTESIAALSSTAGPTAAVSVTVEITTASSTATETPFGPVWRRTVWR